MSTQITTAFVNQFSANVQMLSQQMGSLLRNAVDIFLRHVTAICLLCANAALTKPVSLGGHTRCKNYNHIKWLFVLTKNLSLHQYT